MRRPWWRRPGVLGTVAVVALAAIGVGGFTVRRVTGTETSVPTVPTTVAPVAPPPTLVPSPTSPPATGATQLLPAAVVAVLDQVGVPVDQRGRVLQVHQRVRRADQATAWTVVVDGSTGSLPTCGDDDVRCAPTGAGDPAGPFHVVVVVPPSPATLDDPTAPSIGVSYRRDGAVVTDESMPDHDTNLTIEADLAGGTVAARTWDGRTYRPIDAAGRVVVTSGAVVLALPVDDPDLPFRVWLRPGDGATELLPDRALFASTLPPVTTP